MSIKIYKWKFSIWRLRFSEVAQQRDRRAHLRSPKIWSAIELVLMVESSHRKMSVWTTKISSRFTGEILRVKRLHAFKLFSQTRILTQIPTIKRIGFWLEELPPLQTSSVPQHRKLWCSSSCTWAVYDGLSTFRRRPDQSLTRSPTAVSQTTVFSPSSSQLSPCTSSFLRHSRVIYCISTQNPLEMQSSIGALRLDFNRRLEFSLHFNGSLGPRQRIGWWWKWIKATDRRHGLSLPALKVPILQLQI